MQCMETPLKEFRKLLHTNKKFIVIKSEKKIIFPLSYIRKELTRLISFI